MQLLLARNQICNHSSTYSNVIPLLGGELEAEMKIGRGRNQIIESSDWLAQNSESSKSRNLLRPTSDFWGCDWFINRTNPFFHSLLLSCGRCFGAGRWAKRRFKPQTLRITIFKFIPLYDHVFFPSISLRLQSKIDAVTKRERWVFIDAQFGGQKLSEDMRLAENGEYYFMWEYDSRLWERCMLIGTHKNHGTKLHSFFPKLPTGSVSTV